MPSIFTKTTPTEVVIVLDRSGSMSTIRNAMENALAEYLGALKGQEVYVTLYQFDEKFEPIFHGIPVAEVPRINIFPRGGTALYDAVGLALNRIEIANAFKNHKVSFVVVTDGEENSSKEFRASDIKPRIERLQNNWQFTFLGANQNAWNASSVLGIAAGQTMTFAANVAGTQSAMAATANRTMLYASKGLDQSYTKQDIDDQIKAGAKI